VAPKVTRKDHTETYSCEGQISCNTTLLGCCIFKHQSKPLTYLLHAAESFLKG